MQRAAPTAGELMDLVAQVDLFPPLLTKCPG
jgi:hypothetical protein